MWTTLFYVTKVGHTHTRMHAHTHTHTKDLVQVQNKIFVPDSKRKQAVSNSGNGNLLSSLSYRIKRVKLALEQTPKAQREIKGIYQLFL